MFPLSSRKNAATIALALLPLAACSSGPPTSSTLDGVVGVGGSGGGGLGQAGLGVSTMAGAASSMGGASAGAPSGATNGGASGSGGGGGSASLVASGAGGMSGSGGTAGSGGGPGSGGVGTDSGGAGGATDPCTMVTCGPGQTCSEGLCSCETGMACPDGCFDTQEDRGHCGDCNTQCDPDGACVSGACVNPTCDPDTEVRQGHITTYNLATGLVACHYPTDKLPQHYGAMNTYDYEAAGVCGACVEVTNTQNNSKLVVQIVDECPDVPPNQQWCFEGSHHIDLNGAAYGALGASNNPGISWKYVPCDVQGNIQYNIDAATQEYYLQITPMNLRNRVAKMEAKDGSDWVELQHTTYNTYEAEMGIGLGDAMFRLTDIYNHVVTDTIPLTPGQVVTGNVQFPACP